MDYKYYCGELNKGTYESISENKITEGFITLRNVRYWTLEDSIEIYEDDHDTGVLLIRLKHINFIKVKKGDPIHIYPENQLTRRAFAQREKELQQISN